MYLFFIDLATFLFEDRGYLKYSHTGLKCAHKHNIVTTFYRFVQEEMNIFNQDFINLTWQGSSLARCIPCDYVRAHWNGQNSRATVGNSII